MPRSSASVKKFSEPQTVPLVILAPGPAPHSLPLSRLLRGDRCRPVHFPCRLCRKRPRSSLRFYCDGLGLVLRHRSSSTTRIPRASLATQTPSRDSPAALCRRRAAALRAMSSSLSATSCRRAPPRPRAEPARRRTSRLHRRRRLRDVRRLLFGARLINEPVRDHRGNQRRRLGHLPLRPGRDHPGTAAARRSR